MSGDADPGDADPGDTGSNCSRCGGTLDIVIEGSSKLVHCAACGWSVATTNTAAMQFDETDYAVIFEEAEASTANIRLVAEVTGRNFLEARTFILNAQGETLLEGKARAIDGKVQKLKPSAIRYRSLPPYPY